MSFIQIYLVLVPVTYLSPTDFIAERSSGLARLTRMYVQVLASAAGILIVSLGVASVEPSPRTIVRSPAEWATEDLNQNSSVSYLRKSSDEISL